MKTSAGPTADDCVLVYTRVVSLCIVPFLIAGFVILYLFPQHTARLWAWPLHPTMTAMVLASAYLGGAYFFVRAALERRWHVLSPGFLSVTLFATLLGVATVLQWNKFTHDNPAFWIWSALYFTGSILLATLRAHDQLDSSKPLAWPLLVGFSLLFFASIIVWSRHSLHSRRTLDHPAPIA